MIAFEAYRRSVLKELTKVKTYKHFHVCVKSFNDVRGLDKFAESLLPLMRAMWQQKMQVVDAAARLDSLTKANMVAGMLYAAEIKNDKRGSR